MICFIIIKKRDMGGGMLQTKVVLVFGRLMKNVSFKILGVKLTDF